MKQTILMVDDHANVRTLVADYLSEQGYGVVEASDGNEGLLVARRVRPDLVLLDVMMPNLDGLGFLQAFRRDYTVPVILLTARIEETDKVVGLELGADDYVTKPFGMKELVARIRAALRRATTPQRQGVDERLRVGELVLDRATREVTLCGQSVNLTPTEFTLLGTLMASPSRVFSREQLLEQLGGGAFEGVERTIDVHVRNLRKKLEPDPARPRYVETVFGAGYRCRAQPGR